MSSLSVLTSLSVLAYSPLVTKVKARPKADTDTPEWARVISSRRSYLRKTQEQIASDSGDVLYQTEVSRIENGKVHPVKDLPLEKFFPFLKGYEWNLEEFETETKIAVPDEIKQNLYKEASEQALKAVAIPLTAYTIPTYNAGTGPAWDEAEAEMVTVYLPELKGYDRKRLIGLWARGESMAPYLPDGSLAIIYLDPGMAEPGKAVSVWFSDDGVSVKRYWGETRAGGLQLGNDNPSYPRSADVPDGSRITGVVIKRVLDA